VEHQGHGVKVKVIRAYTRSRMGCLPLKGNRVLSQMRVGIDSALVKLSVPFAGSKQENDKRNLMAPRA